MLTNVVNTIKEGGMSIKGRNSVMVGIRISEDVNTIIRGLADKKGMTVSGFIKWKVEDFVDKAVNTTKETSHSVNRKLESPESVNTINKTFHSVNSNGSADKSVNTITKTSRSVNSPVNTMKDVLTDREGRKYKVIGGVRYTLHNNHSASQ